MWYCEFLAKSNGSKILKIDQHLAKLLTKNTLVFFDSRCSIHVAVVIRRHRYVRLLLLLHDAFHNT